MIRTTTRSTLFCTGLFFVLAVIGAAHHEMWRDELQIWLICRESGSLLELWHNTQLEGHPILWYLLNYVLAYFTESPVAMQCLSVCIGTASCYLVVSARILPRAHRLLFVFGYYSLFEYTVISRNYGLECLLLFLFCRLYPTRYRHYLPMAVVLALLANTHVIGALFAGAFLLLLIIDGCLNRERLTKGKSRHAIGSAVAIVIAGFVVGVVPLALEFFPGENLVPAIIGMFTHPVASLGRVSMLTVAYLPIPDVSADHVWNTHFLAMLPAAVGQWVGNLTGLALIGAMVTLLRGHRQLLVFYAVGVGGLFVLASIADYFMVRHMGHFFILSWVALWLLRITEGAPTARKESRAVHDAHTGSGFWIRRFCPGVIVWALIAQCVAGLYMLTLDFRRPFSHAANVAEFIRRSPSTPPAVAGYIDFTVSPVTAYLDRAIFFPQTGHFGTYTEWADALGEKRNRMSEDELLQGLVPLSKRVGLLMLVVDTSHTVPLCPPEGSRLDPTGWQISWLQSFGGAIVRDENYVIYSIVWKGD